MKNIIILIAFGAMCCMGCKMEKYKVEPTNERAVSPNVKRQYEELKDN